MATNTTNLNLRKAEGTDLVNVLADLGDNWQKIDDLLGPLNVVWEAIPGLAWGASGVAPVIGNGTLVGRFKKVGKTYIFHILLTMGATTTYGTGIYFFTVPVVARNANGIQIIKSLLADVSAGTSYPGIGQVVNNTGSVYPGVQTAGGAYAVFSYTGPATPVALAAGDQIIVSGIIEVD